MKFAVLIFILFLKFYGMLLRFPVSKMPPREVQSKNKITSLLPQQKSDSKVDTFLQPLPQHVTKKLVLNSSQL